MVFAWDFEHGGEGRLVVFEPMPDPVRNLDAARQVSESNRLVTTPQRGGDSVLYMLVDEKDANILAVCRQPVKGSLYRGVVRLVCDDEKVLLRIGAGRDVLGSPWP